jgi:hypothetical protein
MRVSGKTSVVVIIVTFRQLREIGLGMQWKMTPGMTKEMTGEQLEDESYGSKL